MTITFLAQRERGIRRATLALSILAFSILAACGGALTGSAQSISDNGNTADQTVTKDTSGNNLLTLAGGWPTWDGQSSGITYTLSLIHI